MGPLPLPRDPLGLRHVHLRVPVPGVARAGGPGRRAQHPRLPGRHRRGGRHRPAHPVPDPGAGRLVVLASRRAGRCRCRSGRTRPRGRYTCSFLWICSGYYDYEHPHRPTFAGESDFEGTIVHAQLWPADLDWDGKRVVVVGSGATAVTLVPALAARAGSVTMLQRSPTWMTARPSTDRVADALRRRLPAGRGPPDPARAQRDPLPGLLPAVPAATGRWPLDCSAVGSSASSTTTPCSTPTSPPRTDRGTNGCA